jgi:hypothetical protein
MPRRCVLCARCTVATQARVPSPRARTAWHSRMAGGAARGVTSSPGACRAVCRPSCRGAGPCCTVTTSSTRRTRCRWATCCRSCCSTARPCRSPSCRAPSRCRTTTSSRASSISSSSVPSGRRPGMLKGAVLGAPGLAAVACTLPQRLLSFTPTTSLQPTLHTNLRLLCRLPHRRVPSAVLPTTALPTTALTARPQVNLGELRFSEEQCSKLAECLRHSGVTHMCAVRRLPQPAARRPLPLPARRLASLPPPPLPAPPPSRPRTAADGWLRAQVLRVHRRGRVEGEVPRHHPGQPRQARAVAARPLVLAEPSGARRRQELSPAPAPAPAPAQAQAQAQTQTPTVSLTPT